MINKEFSFKDFTHMVMTDYDPKDFEGEIVGSCFYQEVVDRHIFPEKMTGVTFKRSNLDNVFIPKGNVVESDCTNKRIMVQNDLDDWIVDKDLKPTEPVNAKYRTILGISNDPKDLPVKPLKECVINTARNGGA